MPTSVTEADLRANATAEAFRRGAEYERRGAVGPQTLRGDVLEAEVQGSEPAPYLVRITLREGLVAAASCTCPYEWGGWCKHVVAAALAWVHHPLPAEPAPALGTLLAGLDRTRLQTLIEKLVERDPALRHTVEAELALQAVVAPPAAGAPPRRAADIDVRPVRREVRAVLHSLDRMNPSAAYWAVGGVVDGVRRVLEQAWDLVRAGEGRAALLVLEAITDEYVSGWTELDDSSGNLGDFFEEIGSAWTEALLTDDLSPAERERWTRKLERWAQEASDYGIEDPFDPPLAAAVHGWDDPRPQRTLRGESPPQAAPDEANDVLASMGG